MPPIEDLIDYEGILFDPLTGKTYFRQFDYLPITETPFRFERASWDGPWWAAPVIGIFNIWGGRVRGALNPLGFAAHDTAINVLGMCRAARANNGTLGWSCELDETEKNLGPFTRTIERLIVVRRADGNPVESFSCGRLATSAIRIGTRNAMENWLAEVRLALSKGAQ